MLFEKMNLTDLRFTWKIMTKGYAGTPCWNEKRTKYGDRSSVSALVKEFFLNLCQPKAITRFAEPGGVLCSTFPAEFGSSYPL